jgi:hypothetical protein
MDLVDVPQEVENGLMKLLFSPWTLTFINLQKLSPK